MRFHRLYHSNQHTNNEYIQIISKFKKLIFSDYELNDILFECYETNMFFGIKYIKNQFNYPIINIPESITHLRMGFNFNQLLKVLFNIGFIESNKDTNEPWKCHAYHDIDLISENDRLIYACRNNPFHLTYRISKFNYK